MGRQIQSVTHTEIQQLDWTIQGETGTSAQQDEPFVLSLVVPKPVRTCDCTGVNQLQPPAWATLQIAHGFLTRGRRRIGQKIADARHRRLGGLTPTAADLIPPGTSKLHHLVVVMAGGEFRAAAWILLD